MVGVRVWAEIRERIKYQILPSPSLALSEKCCITTQDGIKWLETSKSKGAVGYTHKEKVGSGGVRPRDLSGARPALYQLSYKISRQSVGANTEYRKPVITDRSELDR